MGENAAGFSTTLSVGSIVSDSTYAGQGRLHHRTEVEQAEWRRSEGEAVERSRSEFQKRAAFALLWSLTVPRQNCPERNVTYFVKKAVNLALRALGKRNRELNHFRSSLRRATTGSCRVTQYAVQ